MVKFTRGIPFLQMATATVSSDKLATPLNENAPFIIGVTGGTSCGKTELCESIIRRLSEGESSMCQQVSILSQDCFYKSLTPEEKVLADSGNYNFDHPDAFDVNLMIETLKGISQGKTVQIATYDFATCQRSEETKSFSPSQVVLFEGILVLYYPEVRELLQMKLFVDLDSDTRLMRRVQRDTKERGRDLATVLNQYTLLVKPAFEELTLPTKKYADIIIPRGVENTVAVDLILQHIKTILQGGIAMVTRPPASQPSVALVGKKQRTRNSSLSDSASRPH